MALATIEIRLNAASVANGNGFDILPNLKDLNPKFVAENSRVFDKGHRALKTTQICAADSYGANLHKCLFISRWRWLRDLADLKQTGLS